MIDPADLKPGMIVSVRATVSAAGVQTNEPRRDGDGEVSTGEVDRRGVLVTFDGARPPFTEFSVTVTAEEIESILAEAPEASPLEVGERVRDETGRKYEVIDAPRKKANGKTVVGLWSEDGGFDWAYPERLERVTGAELAR